MPRFDPPPAPPSNQSIVALTARIAALELRLAAIESAVVIGIDRSVTIAAPGQLKLSSPLRLDIATPRVDLSAVIVNAVPSIVKCDTVTATAVSASGRRL